jgi:DNA-binding transcriptional MerR regulator
MLTEDCRGLMEVARETGVPYWRIIYAERAGHLPEPRRVARKRVYQDEDVRRIRNFFSRAAGGRDALLEPRR